MLHPSLAVAVAGLFAFSAAAPAQTYPSQQALNRSLTVPVVTSDPANNATIDLSKLPIALTGNNKVKFYNDSLVSPGTPAGGDQSYPTYHTFSNFDYQSIMLAMNQELIELDLFEDGLNRFSAADFEAAGFNAADRELILFMANQEVGHAVLLGDMLGAERAPKRCTYKYPYTNVQEFVKFCQLLTRFGESGVYGFLAHLDNRSVAQLLLQSITTEARQQMTFRQFQGLQPYPVSFETGITQSMAWTLLSPYISSCPSNNPKIEWSIFPRLTINNQPAAPEGPPAVTTDHPAFIEAGGEVQFVWEPKGKLAGYDGEYKTSSQAGEPKYALFVSQLNSTYAPLYNVGNYSAACKVPNGTVFSGYNDPIVNGSMFVALTDSNLHVTSYNLSAVNAHIVAGPAILQSG